ncbi:hypothetical protein, partial [Verminephrobacter aporrectodeae]|uniref:hypothetical protein n=1 Tax=Verminephrobacter aporrectodeae TaxID=1110389 RepID=UPI00191BDA96
MHLFTDIETRDDAFGTDEHAIVAADHFLAGPPAAVLEDEGIPNLGWATFFGREYTKEIDAEKLRANGFAVEAIGDGHLVILTENIFDVADNFPLFSARRSELKKLLRPGFIRLTNEPLNQATELPENSTPDPDNTGQPAGMIGGNSGISLSLDSKFKAQLQIAAATKAPYALVVTPLNQVISKELWDRVHEVQGTVYQINPPETIETIRILKRPKSTMRMPYIKISIVTDIDTTKWEFGRKVLETFCETDPRLMPDHIDSEAKIRKLFHGIAACEKYWA